MKLIILSASIASVFAKLPYYGPHVTEDGRGELANPSLVGELNYDFNLHREAATAYVGGRDTRPSTKIPLYKPDFIDVRCARTQDGSKGYDYHKGNAIDGLKYGTTGPYRLTQSDKAREPEWIGQFEDFYDWTRDVGIVKVWFNDNCCFDEHKNFRVAVNGFYHCKPKEDLTATFVKKHIDEGVPVEFFCPYHTRGRYIQLKNFNWKRISIMEVEVWSFPWNLFTESTVAPPTTAAHQGDGVPGASPGQANYQTYEEIVQESGLTKVDIPISFAYFSAYYWTTTNGVRNVAGNMLDGDKDTYGEGRSTGANAINAYFRNTRTVIKEAHVWLNPEQTDAFYDEVYMNIGRNDCTTESDLSDPDYIAAHHAQGKPIIFVCPDNTKSNGLKFYLRSNKFTYQVSEIEFFN